MKWSEVVLVVSTSLGTGVLTSGVAIWVARLTSRSELNRLRSQARENARLDRRDTYRKFLTADRGQRDYYGDVLRGVQHDEETNRMVRSTWAEWNYDVQLVGSENVRNALEVYRAGILEGAASFKETHDAQQLAEQYIALLQSEPISAARKTLIAVMGDDVREAVVSTDV